MSGENKYVVNEIYYSLHGEGKRYGIPHVFVRFAQCNLTCGFCDTEYESGREMTGAELVNECKEVSAIVPNANPHVEGARQFGRMLEQKPCRNIVLCGGEPLLQVDPALINTFKNPEDPWFLCVETNGTCRVPEGIDWVTVSPKVAEHVLKVKRCNEVKYVRAKGHGIPHPIIEADHYLISPMFNGEVADPAAVQWCIDLVKNNPQWSLTVQHHKLHFGQMR